MSSIIAKADRQDIPVPQQDIKAGQLITEHLLTKKNFEVPPLAYRHFVTESAQALGLIAKRHLQAGKPISLNWLKNRDTVQQGTLTKAYLTAKGLSISTFVIPLKSGRYGDQIEARNPDYNTIVKAQVQADGTLLVEIP